MTYKDIWIKGLPFKIDFFIWRMWKGKVIVDDNVRRWGIQGQSRCWCCANPAQETMNHMHLRLDIANMNWSYFSSFTRMNIQGLSLRKTMLAQWNTDIRQRIKAYFQGLPRIIIWELWRRRNNIKHEVKNIIGQRMMYNITRNLKMLLKISKLNLEFCYEWPGILKEFQQLNTELEVLQLYGSLHKKDRLNIISMEHLGGFQELVHMHFVLEMSKGT